MHTYSMPTMHKPDIIARTIADLEGDERIREQHLSETIQYRSLVRKTS